MLWQQTIGAPKNKHLDTHVIRLCPVLPASSPRAIHLNRLIQGLHLSLTGQSHQSLPSLLPIASPKRNCAIATVIDSVPHHSDIVRINNRKDYAQGSAGSPPSDIIPIRAGPRPMRFQIVK